MKAFLLQWVAFLLAAWTTSCPAAEPFDPNPGGRHRAEDPEASDIGPHHRVVRVEHPVTSPDGRVETVTGSYVELATGLNRFDADRTAWVPARTEFELTADGHAVARHTQHQVILAPDLRTESAVDFLTPDGVRLRSTPLGLGALDTVTGRSFLLAEVQPSAPVLVTATEVIYPDAFEGVQADLRYRLALDRFEQDLILREQIAPEWLEELGLNPATTRLFMMTEFFDPPKPKREARPMRGRGSGRELANVRLDFGQMAIGEGRAFGLERDANSDNPSKDGVPVGKAWEVLEGRQFLIESVEYLDLAPLMETLPDPGQANAGNWAERARRTAALPRRVGGVREARVGAPHFEKGRILLPPGERLASKPASPTLVARLTQQPGVVVDYVLSTGQANFTFQADTTYQVTGAVDLTGTATFEGGAVIKYNAGQSLRCSGTAVFKGDFYRPVIFTAKDDNSVGQVIAGSTGVPSGYYANPAVEFRTGGSQSKHVRVAHAQSGFLFYDSSAGSGNVVSHAQFVRCGTALRFNGYGTTFQNFNVRNVLMHTVGTAFYGYSFNGTIQHLTVNGGTILAVDYQGQNYGTTSSLSLLNSLLVNVSSLSGSRPVTVTYDPTYTRAINSSTGVFASVGAGANYLPAGSPYRAAGTAAINATLLAELRAWGTTRAPAVWTTAITADTVWEPLAERSAGLPDLGYHYPALDYAVSGVSLNNATLTLTNGVAVAVYGASGLTITGAGKLRGEGTPTRLNRLVRHSAVQEQALAAWEGGTSGTLLKDDAAGQSASEVRLRFTEFVVPAAGGHHFNGGARLGRLALTDCELHGGNLNFNAAGTYARVVALTNNVLNRVSFSLGTGADTTLTTYARNNLFRSITTGNLNAASGNAWEWRDNLFDTADLRQYYAGAANGNNAYRNCPRQLTPAGSGNVTLTALSYLADSWGRGWYASVTPSLLNAGSRTASAAGLWHHTTQTSQAKEQSTQVDIGFHYVALDAAGRPQDYDGDGLPDYFEDRNGNGISTPDAGETNWQQSQNGTFGVPGLQVYTPLRP